MTNTTEKPKIITASALLRNTYRKIASIIGDLDEDIIAANREIADEKLIPDERYVSLESAVFIATRFALMTAMLVLDYKNARNVFASAIDTEIQLDEMPQEKRKMARENMADEKMLHSSHMIEIGLTMFSEETMSEVMKLLYNGFTELSDTILYQNVDAAQEAMTAADRQIIGIILSSYIYLIRAFNYNAAFTRKIDELIAQLIADYS